MIFLNCSHCRIINRTSAVLRFKLDLENYILCQNRYCIIVILLKDLLALKKLMCSDSYTASKEVRVSLLLPAMCCGREMGVEKYLHFFMQSLAIFCHSGKQHLLVRDHFRGSSWSTSTAWKEVEEISTTMILSTVNVCVFQAQFLSGKCLCRKTPSFSGLILQRHGKNISKTCFSQPWRSTAASREGNSPQLIVHC